MANSDTGSRSNGMDHDFLAAFLAGEVQSRHLDSLKAAGGGLLCPGVGEELDAPGLEAQNPDSGATDANPSCSNCCSNQGGDCDLVTHHPKCDTKLQCQTHAKHCKSHEPGCKHKHNPGYEPPKHASWFDRP